MATKDLVFENEHIPVSVSLADTLNREPEHICSKHPQELVRKFWEAIVRRGEVLREDMKQNTSRHILSCYRRNNNWL